MKIVYCDVGQGDAALIIYHNTQVLIDGGPDARVMNCLGRYVPFYDHNIEFVVMTHPQADHAQGLLNVIDRYKLNYFVTGPEANQTKGYSDLLELLKRKNINVKNLYAGNKIEIGTLKLEVVWPTKNFVTTHLKGGKDLSMENILGLTTDGTDLNSFGIVLVATFDEVDALFMADVDRLAQPELLETGRVRDVEILKVPHHGSKTGMMWEWLNIVSPDLSVISVGSKNRYGHPGFETLKMLQDVRSKILRTDVEGDVVVEVDGKRWWLK